jgi:hypothetical protein
MCGAATALLLTALVVTRAMRREPDEAKEVRDRAVELLRESVQEIREHPREVRKPAIMGIGVGGLALVAGGTFAVWKLLRSGQPDRSTWYSGE